MSSNTDADCSVAYLEFLGQPVDEVALAKDAVEQARFSKMQKTEKKTGIPGHDYDRSDEDSLRVRKGKVGGFSDTLKRQQRPSGSLQICRETMVRGSQKR